MKDYIRAQKITSESKKAYDKKMTAVMRKYIDACLNCKEPKCDGNCSFRKIMGKKNEPNINV